MTEKTIRSAHTHISYLVRVTSVGSHARFLRGWKPPWAFAFVFFYQIQPFSNVCLVYGSEENFWESIFSVLVTGTFIQVPSPPPLWVFSKHKPLWPQFFEEMHFHFAGFVPCLHLAADPLCSRDVLGRSHSGMQEH